MMTRVKMADVLFYAHQNDYNLSIITEKEKAFKRYQTPKITLDALKKA